MEKIIITNINYVITNFAFLMFLNSFEFFSHGGSLDASLTSVLVSNAFLYSFGVPNMVCPGGFRPLVQPP